MGEGLGEPPLGTLNILVNSLVLPQNHLCIFLVRILLMQKLYSTNQNVCHHPDRVKTSKWQLTYAMLDDRS